MIEFHPMREIEAILKDHFSTDNRDMKRALATVVHVQGSSYRRPGARMLVWEDGRITGAISGGCLESDALRKAQLAMATNAPRLVVYDTSNEEDASIGIQLGCNGVITVLFEPITSNHSGPLNLLDKIVEKRQPTVVVTMVAEGKTDLHPGTCLVITQEKKIFSTLSSDLHEKVLEEAIEVLNHGHSKHLILSGPEEKNLNVFLEYISPPIHLVIAGAGNDAVPLVEMAEILGWSAHVVDGRNTHTSGNRFPPSCAVRLAKPEEALTGINPDPFTAFILITHNFQYDKALLKILLPLEVPYIGILGPKKKLDRMILELRQEGIFITEAMLKKVFGPVGLEIGAEHPAEIALSILAEIQAVITGKPGGFLRDKTTVIHS